MCSFALFIIVAALALQASASTTCNRISGRYAGSGQGVVWNTTENTSSPYNAVSVFDVDSQGNTASGQAYVLANGQITQIDLTGTFTVDDSCIINVHVKVGNIEHHLTGFAGENGSVFVTDLTSGTAVNWQWYPAPQSCSASSLSGEYTGVGYVLDGSGEKVEGVAGEANGQGNGVAQLTFVTTERPDPTELTGLYQVDSSCTMNTLLGFAGVVFNRGVVALSSISGGEFVSITVFSVA